jgi:rhodanese-related sulfurtransferase
MLSKLKELLRPRPAVPQTLRWIECADLASRLTSDRLVVVDVRGPDEFNGLLGHIEGAVNIPVGCMVADRTVLDALRDRDVVLVCRTDRRSARAAAHLASLACTGVLVLRGGMESWNAVGLPAIRDGVRLS